MTARSFALFSSLNVSSLPFSLATFSEKHWSSPGLLRLAPWTNPGAVPKFVLCFDGFECEIIECHIDGNIIPDMSTNFGSIINRPLRAIKFHKV